MGGVRRVPCVENRDVPDRVGVASCGGNWVGWEDWGCRVASKNCFGGERGRRGRRRIAALAVAAAAVVIAVALEEVRRRSCLRAEPRSRWKIVLRRN